MRIGLLVCDHIVSRYADQYGDYPKMFADLFPDFSFHNFDAINGVLPRAVNDMDGFMVTGSRHAVYDDLDWIIKLKQITKDIYEAGVPLIGFCFGHQLIAESLGGKVTNHDNGWCIGMHDLQVNQKQPWMQPARNKLRVLMMCEDQVMLLPKGAISIAGNQYCKHAVIQTGEHFLGIQGHPEFPKALNRQMVLDRKERYHPDTYDRALDSFQDVPDTQLLRSWIEAFLKI